MPSGFASGAGPKSVHVTGSMKYDGAQTDRDNPATRRLAALAGFAADDVVLLAGSTQEPEEAAALDVFRRLQPAWPQAAAGAGAAASRAVRGGRAGCWTRRASPGSAGPPELGRSKGRSRLLAMPGSCWSTWWASWGPGGARRQSPSSAGAWAIAAGRT